MRREKRRTLMIGSQLRCTASFIVRRITPAVFFTAALAFTPAIPAVAGSGVYSGAPISLELVDADLQDVLTALSKITDFVFAIDAQTAEMEGLDHLISVNYESVPWDRALDGILIEAGLEWTLEGQVLWIHLPAYSPTGDRNFTGDAINFRFADAKLVDVLDSMSKVSGLKIDFDPDLDASVSVNLRSVPWDQSLDLILRISGFDYAQENDVIKVYQVSDGKGLQLITTSDI